MSAISLNLISGSLVKKPLYPKNMKMFLDLDGVFKYKNNLGEIKIVGGVSVSKETTVALEYAYDAFGINAGEGTQRDFNEKAHFIIKSLMNSVPHPTYVQPTISINTILPSFREVGSSVTISISSNFVKNDAGAIISRSIRKNDSDVSALLTFSETIPSMPYSTITYQARVAYDDGATKNNNVGVPDPVGKITAGVINSVIRSIVGGYPVFYGSILPSQSVADINISSLTKSEVTSSGTVSANFSNVVNKRLIIMIPLESTLKTKWYVNALNAGNINGSGDLFTSGSTKTFNSPSGYWSSKSYRVYMSTPTSIDEVMELRN